MAELTERIELSNKSKIELAVTDQCFAVYHDNEFKEADVDVEVCVVVTKAVAVAEPLCFRRTEAVAMMACTMVYGPTKISLGLSAPWPIG